MPCTESGFSHKVCPYVKEDKNKPNTSDTIWSFFLVKIFFLRYKYSLKQWVLLFSVNLHFWEPFRNKRHNLSHRYCKVDIKSRIGNTSLYTGSNELLSGCSFRISGNSSYSVLYRMSGVCQERRLTGWPCRIHILLLSGLKWFRLLSYDTWNCSYLFCC